MGRARPELEYNQDSTDDMEPGKVIRHKISSLFSGSRTHQHFHDTSSSSPLKQPGKTMDYKYLRSDGNNLAAVLYKIKDFHPKHFKMIEYTNSWGCSFESSHRFKLRFMI